MEKKYYSVWVGDGEVNENYIEDKNEALSIADAWKAKDYDDVFVEELVEDENGNIVHNAWL